MITTCQQRISPSYKHTIPLLCREGIANFNNYLPRTGNAIIRIICCCLRLKAIFFPFMAPYGNIALILVSLAFWAYE